MGKLARLSEEERNRILADYHDEVFGGLDIDPEFGDRPDTPELRAETADRFATGTDTRIERYWALMGVINGWPPFPAMTPAFSWTIDALRAHPVRD